MNRKNRRKRKKAESGVFDVKYRGSNTGISNTILPGHLKNGQHVTNKDQVKIRSGHSLLGASVIPDPPDDRDYKFANIPDENRILKASSSLPNKASWVNEMTPVKYQGEMGSCVAFALCALKEWQEMVEHKREVKEGKEDHRNQTAYNFSEQWVFWNAKKIDPWGPDVDGTNFRSGFKVLQKIGVPTEKAWPYSDDRLNIGEPKKWASLIARWAKIGSYWRIGNHVDELRRALVEGPVVIGIPCFGEMYRRLVNGYIPYPEESTAYAWHAVLAVGYDDTKKLVTIKNSWSSFWGRRGYGDLDYLYINDWMFDAWIAKDITVTKEMLKGASDLIG